ncbi:unnamed protein product, partial [marine sediment metagenome]
NTAGHLNYYNTFFVEINNNLRINLEEKYKEIQKNPDLNRLNDLFINFRRINIKEYLQFGTKLYNNEEAINHTFGFELPRKWNLLEMVTERTGSMIKYIFTFPYFFTNLMYTLQDQNIQGIEFRTTIGNVYDYKIENGILKKNKSGLGPRILNEYIQPLKFHMYLMESLWINANIMEERSNICMKPIIDINDFRSTVIDKCFDTVNENNYSWDQKIYYLVIGATGKPPKYGELDCERIKNSIGGTFKTAIELLGTNLENRIIGFDLYGEE